MIPLRARASSKTGDNSRQNLNKHTHNVNGKEGKAGAAELFRTSQELHHEEQFSQQVYFIYNPKIESYTSVNVLNLRLVN